MTTDGPALITKPAIAVQGRHVSVSLCMMDTSGHALGPGTRAALTPTEAIQAARELLGAALQAMVGERGE